MKPWPVLALVGAFWCLAALGLAFPDTPGLGQLLVVLVLSVSLSIKPAWAAVLGLVAGLAGGAISGANAMPHMLSLMVGCFGLAWIQDWGLEVKVPLAMLAVGLGTLVSGLLFMFLAGPPDLLRFLTDTILHAVLNGVLAAPVYGLVRLFAGPGDD